MAKLNRFRWLRSAGTQEHWSLYEFPQRRMLAYVVAGIGKNRGYWKWKAGRSGGWSGDKAVAMKRVESQLAIDIAEIQ